MSLSEREIDARLTELRSRRAAIDREIADLLLYLELGRRLGGSGAPPDAATAPSSAPPPAPSWTAAPDRPRSPPARVTETDRDLPPPDRDHGPADRPPADRPAPVRDPTPGSGAIEKNPPPAVGFAEDAKAARRYGRALIEAACAAIARAGRPLHAGEILERLAAEGFTVPGADPVAALNTRLWKRATPEGPLRRLGDARYALAEPGAA